MKALQCGTLNGAKYVGLNGDLGSLEVGKLADILVMEPGADPTKNIQHSERVQLTVANGRIFIAKTMAELDKSTVPNFYWRLVGNGISYPFPIATGCSCGRSAN